MEVVGIVSRILSIFTCVVAVCLVRGSIALLVLRTWWMGATGLLVCLDNR